MEGLIFILATFGAILFFINRQPSSELKASINTEQQTGGNMYTGSSQGYTATSGNQTTETTQQTYQNKHKDPDILQSIGAITSGLICFGVIIIAIVSGMEVLSGLGYVENIMHQIYNALNGLIFTICLCGLMIFFKTGKS
jgi:hypothetical protein